MAQGSYNISGDEVKEESSWRYPLIILGATLVLCVIFLYHYVGPDVEEIQGNKPRPTVSDEIIEVSVGGIRMDVPANYMKLPRDRRPGEREVLTLYAAWPRLEGFAPTRREDFIENEPDARRIDMLVLEKRVPLMELQRLEILYLPETVESGGVPFEHGLVRHVFKQGSAAEPASGYSDKELFIGELEDGSRAVLLCYKGEIQSAVPPECYREYDLSETVSVKYYFKRPYLAEWRQIDAGVRGLITRFSES